MTSDAIIHMEQSLFVNTTLQMLPNDRAKYKHSSWTILIYWSFRVYLLGNLNM